MDALAYISRLDGLNCMSHTHTYTHTLVGKYKQDYKKTSLG